MHRRECQNLTVNGVYWAQGRLVSYPLNGTDTGAEMEIGDIVMVPCQIIGRSKLAYTKSVVLDLLPIERSSGKHYEKKVVNMFSVLASDVDVLDKGKD
jgi:hypothetical protein